MKIAYVHGFASSSESRTFSIIKKYLPDCEVLAYDMPVSPDEAIDFLRYKIAEDDIDLVIGTSLGAYYALHTFGCAKIALNPPFNPNSVLDDFIGSEINFLNPRKDGAKKFKWEKEYHNQIEYYNADLSNPDLETVCESFLFFSIDDEVVKEYGLFKDYWNKQFIPGGHRVEEEVFREYVLPLLLEIKSYFK